MIFFGGVLRFFHVQHPSSDILTSSFPILMPFILLSSSIALATPSRTVLNPSGGSGHACPVPAQGEMLSTPPHSLGRMLAAGFSYVAFIILGYVLSAPNL